MVSDAASVGIATRDLMVGNEDESDRLGFFLVQPLAARSASASLLLPEANSADGSITRRGERVSLAPEARETILQLTYGRSDAERELEWTAGLFARIHPGHDRDADTDLGAGLRVQKRF